MGALPGDVPAPQWGATRVTHQLRVAASAIPQAAGARPLALPDGGGPKPPVRAAVVLSRVGAPADGWITVDSKTCTQPGEVTVSRAHPSYLSTMQISSKGKKHGGFPSTQCREGNRSFN